MILIFFEEPGEECDYDEECPPGLICAHTVRKYESQVSKRRNHKNQNMAKIESMVMGQWYDNWVKKKKGKCSKPGEVLRE